MAKIGLLRILTNGGKPVKPLKNQGLTGAHIKQ